jgi:hypothetical protein
MEGTHKKREMVGKLKRSLLCQLLCHFPSAYFMRFTCAQAKRMDTAMEMTSKELICIVEWEDMNKKLFICIFVTSMS